MTEDVEKNTADLRLITHPLIEHKLTLMRDARTPSADFRRLMREISTLLAYEVLRDLALEDVAVETPVASMVGRKLSGKSMCFVTILRAGDGLLHGLLDLAPTARVGHLGFFRDPNTLAPISYYQKLPQDIAGRLTIVVDPMLATGGSASAALDAVKAAGARRLRFLALVAAPDGVEAVRRRHSDVAIYAAALDERLDEKGYIVPGLGDAGDRLFGTK